ncbi:hypothetical protein [Helicobacter suis]|uniref:hypothetical protein n=1 Tax=Helicobacter suis TaxID=104628 RepID=UPI0013D50982|nr:hypothetical protein [Helicobacter suis]
MILNKNTLKLYRLDFLRQFNQLSKQILLLESQAKEVRQVQWDTTYKVTSDLNALTMPYVPNAYFSVVIVDHLGIVSALYEWDMAILINKRTYFSINSLEAYIKSGFVTFNLKYSGYLEENSLIYYAQKSKTPL